MYLSVSILKDAYQNLSGEVSLRNADNRWELSWQKKKKMLLVWLFLPLSKKVSWKIEPANFSYLFFLCTLQVPPLLSDMTEVYRVHCNLIFPYDIMFGETIKVINCHH